MGARIRNYIHYQFILSCSFWSPEHDYFYLLLSTLHPSCNPNETSFLVWDSFLSVPAVTAGPRLSPAFTLAAQSRLFSWSLCLQGPLLQATRNAAILIFLKQSYDYVFSRLQFFSGHSLFHSLCAIQASMILSRTLLTVYLGEPRSLAKLLVSN